ncbi:Metalloenzyme, LuxS/M16 peptidase-like protein [Umbelopsis sp. PMI_123]|nr:Metalloenzyme, LuxS/M16 peptidase-like protein [Umbelopsis sp. PMI_123]
MASRLLSTAVKSRVGMAKQFVRPLATSANVATRTTTLSNGLTVATEENPTSQTATVGVWIDAGSRAESAQTNGAAYFLEHLAYKGKASKIEGLGGNFDAYTTREHSAFVAQTFNSNVAQTVDILSEAVQNPNLNAIDEQREVILKEQQKAANNYEQVVFDHLHATAFQGESLGRPIVGTPESIQAITRDDLSNYIKNNFTGDRVVLVGAGNVNHDELCKLAEQKFGSLSSGSLSAKLAQKPKFTGSEIRLRDDTLPEANIALAVEGVSLSSPDYYASLVMQSIIGSWDVSLGGSSFLGSRLSTVVDKNHLARRFFSFNTSYKDTGLWGIYFDSSNETQIDDFVHFTQKEWARLSETVTEGEVERAKQIVKGNLLLGLDGPNAVAQDIATQVLATGKHLSSQEIEQAVSKVTVADIHRLAYNTIWDKEVAVVGHGPIECLPDLLRVRGFMSYNRF